MRRRRHLGLLMQPPPGPAHATPRWIVAALLVAGIAGTTMLVDSKLFARKSRPVRGDEVARALQHADRTPPWAVRDSNEARPPPGQLAAWDVHPPLPVPIGAPLVHITPPDDRVAPAKQSPDVNGGRPNRAVAGLPDHAP